jgi:hypothetical protein
MKWYFRVWLERANLFGDRLDDHCFFLFVKSCLRRNAARRDGQWLREHLEIEGNIPQRCIDKAAEWFDICAEYDESARYYHARQSPDEFQWKPIDARPWSVKLKEEEERRGRRSRRSID